MKDGAAGSAGDEWCVLLAEARQALAHLRVDELEELAARAECRLRATVGQDWIRQRVPRPEAKNLRSLSRGHRLLGDLLRATDSNLAVLRRLKERAGGTERNGRWVR